MTKPKNGIYGILPADLEQPLLLEKAEAALLGGVRILQLRDKKLGFKRRLKRALLLRELCHQYDATFIVNDSLQLALDSGADGVHLGRGDVSDIAQVRSQVKDNFTLGITCHADAQYAKAALGHGADYVSFGAIFASQTKTNIPIIGTPRLSKACSMFPESRVCAIGGIDLTNLVMIKAAGATYAAVISSLFTGNPEEIKINAENMVTLWNNAPSA